MPEVRTATQVLTNLDTAPVAFITSCFPLPNTLCAVKRRNESEAAKPHWFEPKNCSFCSNFHGGVAELDLPFCFSYKCFVSQIAASLSKPADAAIVFPTCHRISLANYPCCLRASIIQNGKTHIYLQAFVTKSVFRRFLLRGMSPSEAFRPIGVALVSFCRVPFASKTPIFSWEADGTFQLDEAQ